jgi:hypothetical protein
VRLLLRDGSDLSEDAISPFSHGLMPVCSTVQLSVHPGTAFLPGFQGIQSLERHRSSASAADRQS